MDHPALTVGTSVRVDHGVYRGRTGVVHAPGTGIWAGEWLLVRFDDGTRDTLHHLEWLKPIAHRERARAAQGDLFGGGL